MNRQSLVFVTLLLSLGCGAAMAKDQTISKVQVHPESQASMEFACASPARPPAADVERLFSVNDHSQTDELSHRLMGAVSEACRAGVPTIAVSRGAAGHSVTWRAARGYDANVALR
jgi:hypothetical protein